MSEEFKHLNEEERLKAENDFLRMKLMLENGAEFGNIESDKDLPPNIENEFLNYIMEFEKHVENPVYIKVFDKIGQPTYFKPVVQITEDEIEEEWNRLLKHLNGHNINFNVCSPNISVRELYRFVTEELFEHEMSDINMPGVTSNFIYDEFYPDPIYENSNVASGECINYILQKNPIEWTHNFRNENIRLNDHFPLTIDELKVISNNYKSAYDDIEIEEIAVKNCIVEEQQCSVDGTYIVKADSGIDTLQFSGSWKVNFEKDDKFGYWYIFEVQVPGINF
jgi:hypothetical protein